MDTKLSSHKRSTKQIIIQANTLIESASFFSNLMEARLFYMALASLRPQLKAGEPTENKVVSIPSVDVIKMFGGNNVYYSRLKGFCRNLQGIQVELQDNEEKGKLVSVVPFPKFEFDKAKGMLSIELHKDFAPYVLELADKPYTQIAASSIFSLKSTHSIKLLELLLQYQGFEKFKTSGVIEREFSLKDLRYYMGIEPDKYLNVSVFIRSVINYSINDINDHTPYFIEYEKIKPSRTITGFKFFLSKQEDAPNLEDSITVAEDDLVDVLLKYGIGKIVANRLIKTYDAKRIKDNVQYTLTQHGVKNIPAYMRKAIEQDYAGNAKKAAMQFDLFEHNKMVEDNSDKVCEDFLISRGIGEMSREVIMAKAKAGDMDEVVDKLLGDIDKAQFIECYQKGDFSSLMDNVESIYDQNVSEFSAAQESLEAEVAKTTPDAEDNDTFEADDAAILDAVEDVPESEIAPVEEHNNSVKEALKNQLVLTVLVNGQKISKEFLQQCIDAKLNISEIQSIVGKTSIADILE
ncbi:replication initiation protein [Anaerovibrio lipolyticus]|uniref:replication initiation protein n=1 Tax=Anaerovibrio lipolyticus TaxID=82374 RepID=UPI0026EEBCED|nr:replication initiation protein [Anaerovibrio lipolyticus]MBE6104751.1 replication initiation protein [Anaerovibrio lipolyticus]